MYTDSHKLKRLRKLPENMLDAVRLFDKSDVARTAFGDEFVDSYVKLKLEEWKRFCRSVTPWELENTLDC
jgi:glutamine synthetase